MSDGTNDGGDKTNLPADLTAAPAAPTMKADSSITVRLGAVVPKSYDVNEDSKGMMLPSPESIMGTFGKGVGGIVAMDSASYASIFEEGFRGLPIGGEDGALGKALQPTPGTNSFLRMSYMPDQTDSNLIQWPGIAPESLGKIVRENLVPQLIIGMRCSDVMRYSQPSSHIWRPGWVIEPIKKKPGGPSVQEKKEILAAEQFLQNSNVETTNAQIRKRDAAKLTNFQGFLSGIVRETLTYDLVAGWTDMSNNDEVKSYAQMPASRIRLVGPQGFKGNADIFACAVDEGGTIKHTFTRDQLFLYRRNIREITECLGYGYSEVEIAVRLIQGFQNAIDLNCDTFNRSAIPNGILVMSGETVTQRQLDLLNRMWTNLKKGITKAWALPVIGLAGKDSKLEVLNLNDLKGMEVYYQDFMNMIAGMFCTVFQFPVTRLGYRISGKGKDSEPNPDSSTVLVGDDDPGLAPLLIHIENIINEYLIWSRWPDLRFRFNAKNPKEDARSYEALKLAKTYGEAREEAGLPKLETLAGGDAKMKKIAMVMNMAPEDPAKQGIYQSLVSALFEPKPAAGAGGKPGQPGARMGSKKDPANAKDHGGTAGVRRDSRAEKDK